MRAPLTFILLGAVAVVLQTTLLERSEILPVAPDLMVILCVYLGLHYQTVGGAVGAFLLGYLLDTFSGSPPGLYALAMTSVFALVYVVSKRLWIENPITTIAVVALGCAIEIATVLVYFAIATPSNVAWLPLTRTLVGPALLGLILSPIVFAALDAHLRPVGPPKGSHAIE